jgi:YD repeat-containing protein
MGPDPVEPATPPRQTEAVVGTNYVTSYMYDGMGNVRWIKYPDSYSLTMTYDVVSRLQTVGSFATLTYTLDDKLNKTTYGDGEVTTYTYDNRDRPTRILDKYQSTTEMDLNYTYDGTGNVLTLNTEAYHYDWLNRLNYSSGPWTTTTYSYDGAGNRIRMVQGSTTTTYCYGKYNRLSNYTTSGCSAPTTSYTYDSNGNTVTKTGGWTYTYDFENRLTKAVHSGTTVQTNSYDGDGNRVQQVAGSTTFTYSYQGLNILYEENVTGSTTTITKHFYANGMQVAKMVGTGVSYVHGDMLGSTRLVATLGGAFTIVFSSNYQPYGQNYGQSGSEVFMYTGGPYDSVTGLY